jgi:single-stranded DNA-binding protein
MVNQIILTGNLGADPEVSYSLEGHPVASFNLAFRVSRKKTGWIKRLFRRKVRLLGMLGGKGFACPQTVK